jgi:hypothetical protein
MSYVLPDTGADTTHSPPDRGLAAVQWRKLAGVSAAAVELAKGINRRAVEADWISCDGAMTFVRVARAVRLTKASCAERQPLVLGAVWRRMARCSRMNVWISLIVT